MEDDTRSAEYAARLQRREDARWKRILNVQAPFRWNLRRLRPGFTLDVGCGIGRNLYAVDGVGVDHNAKAIAVARGRGFTAFTSEEFPSTGYAEAGRFDTMLLAHIVEHMSRQEASDLVATYLPFIRSVGKVIVIAPQEAGFRSDPTHVEYMDHDKIRGLLEEQEVTVEREYSFPFPRPIGKVLRYNEFVTVGRVG